MAIAGKGRPTKEQAASRKKYNSWYQDVVCYEREFKQWEERTNKILKKYRDDRGASNANNSSARFNILWSNVQTLVPATFSRLPQPDASRRFRDNDPVGRVGSMIIERGLDYEIQHYPDYRMTLKACVLDRFLGGRGTAWVRYEPHMKAIDQDLPVNGLEVSEDVDAPGEDLDYECSPVDYVHYKDFGHSVARTWEEVGRVWRKVYMDRAACVDRFGKELGDKIPLDKLPIEQDKAKAQGAETLKACVHEGWDKTTKEAVWFSVSMGEILDTKPDPLGLEEFFPCPRPLYATLTNDSLIPVPDYVLYQDQAAELDNLSNKIDGLIKALRILGVYDASEPSLGRLFSEASNTNLLPIKNWASFAEKNGLAGAIDLVDIEPIARALIESYKAMDQVKGQIFEITGISDIVRGDTDPNETLGAQELKGQYANMRLRSYQDEVAEFATQLLRLKAQVICNKFAVQTIAQMSAVEQLNDADKPLIGPAMELLLGPRATNPEATDIPNILRSFRVDIAADTLVQIDEKADQQARTEMLAAVGTYIEKGFPLVQAAPQVAPLIVGLLKFAVTGFKVGKQIEGMIDQQLDQLTQAAKQPQPPKPDPEMAKVQAQQQADAARLQADQQAEQARMQADMAIERMRNEMQQQTDRQKAVFEFQLEAQRMQQEQLFARFEATLKAKTAVEVAEIGAQATLDGAQIAAANAGTQETAQ